MTWPRALVSLSARNYRLYFFGQMISLMGTWMTSTASLWLVYHLSSSPVKLGLVGFASTAPMFIFAPVAGVWVDRVSRHRLLLLTQVLSMVQSLALAVLTLTNHMTVNLLIALCFVQGMINGVDMPVRQALVAAFVERKEHLGNAIALNSSMFNIARLVGPALAGFIIVGFGAGGCYAMDTLSYGAVIISLLAMRLPSETVIRATRHPLVELREGFHYAWCNKPARAIIVMLGLISFVGFSYTVLMPMFARDHFHGNARTLGYLMSASACGALIGAAYLGSRATIRGLGTVIAWGGALMGTGLIGFAVSTLFALSWICLVVVGLGGVLVMASCNTALQSRVPEELRGRIMSIFTMAFTGTMPLGNLTVGAIANVWGATPALLGAGLFCFLIALHFHRQLPQLRAVVKSQVPVAE